MSKIIKADRLTYTIVKKESGFSEGEKKLDPQNSSVSEAEDIYNETKKMVEELLENARAKSEQIMLEGKLKAETLLEESKAEIEKSFEEAWERGYQEGKKRAEAECEEIRESANFILQQAFNEKEELIKNTESEIVNFLIDTLDRICFGSIVDKKHLTTEISRFLIDYVKDSKGQVILKVSHEDHDFLEDQIDELSLLLTSGTLVLKVDRSLNPGHCIVISDKGILEVDLEENLQKVKAVLQDVIISD